MNLEQVDQLHETELAKESYHTDSKETAAVPRTHAATHEVQ